MVDNIKQTKKRASSKKSLDTPPEKTTAVLEYEEIKQSFNRVKAAFGEAKMAEQENKPVDLKLALKKVDDRLTEVEALLVTILG